DDVTLQVADGETLAVLGPSGCGKSTLLRVVAGLAAPDAGRVFFDGEDVSDVPPQRRGIGMVFQNYALYPNMNTRGNLGFFFGMTSPYVTHDQTEALALADRIAVMRAGRVEQVGRYRDLYDRPATAFVAGFFGAPPMNLLAGTVDGSGRTVMLGASVAIAIPP